MDRRGFLKSVLAAGVAPAFVGSSILMPVTRILTAAEAGFVQSGPGATDVTLQEVLRLYGDGIRDDTVAMQAWLDGKNVLGPDGKLMLRPVLVGGSYRISSTLRMSEDRPVRGIRDATMIGPVKDGPMIHYSRNEPPLLEGIYFDSLGPDSRA